MAENLKTKLKKIVLYCNNNGIPIPLVHDPVRKEPSASLTLVVLSSFVVLVNIGLDLSGVAKESNMTIEFFLISTGLYFGRSFSSKRGTTLEAPEKDKK